MITAQSLKPSCHQRQTVFWQYLQECGQGEIFVVGVGDTRHHPTAVLLLWGWYGPPGLSLYIYTTPIAIRASKKHKSHHFSTYWKSKNIHITLLLQKHIFLCLLCHSFCTIRLEFYHPLSLLLQKYQIVSSHTSYDALTLDILV